MEREVEDKGKSTTIFSYGSVSLAAYSHTVWPHCVAAN
jgi:hypothetical protein